MEEKIYSVNLDGKGNQTVSVMGSEMEFAMDRASGCYILQYTHGYGDFKPGFQARSIYDGARIRSANYSTSGIVYEINIC